MESPVLIINKIISMSLLDPRIEAVVLTGSRGRGKGIDNYSDIDIELIGHGATELFKQAHWVDNFGQPLVVLHLANSDNNEPDWPTCLVVYSEGRKIDFTFAEPERLQKMEREGLDAVYSRGYTVLLDKIGITNKLPDAANQSSLLPKIPTEDDFVKIISDFWLEAHQVAIALARNELWVAWSRSAEMKQRFLSLTECLVSLRSKQDIWYNGRQFHEWMPKQYVTELNTMFNCGTAKKAAKSLYSLMRCFDEVSNELATQLGYDSKQIVSHKMQKIVINVLQDNGLIAEGIF